MIREYRCKYYFDEEDLNEAIEEYLNEDGMYQDEIPQCDIADEYENSDPRNKNDFETYEAWCELHGLKTGHANSLFRYMEEVNE